MIGKLVSERNGYSVRVGDRVRTRTGRRGRVMGVHGEAAAVLWDDGDEFSMRPVHLELEERAFGQDSSHASDTTRRGGL